METDVYRLISHPLQDPSTFWGGLAIHKKIAEKCRRPFSDPPGDLIDRWEHRDGRGRAPRANGSDYPFYRPYLPISGAGKGLTLLLHSGHRDQTCEYLENRTLKVRSFMLENCHMMPRPLHTWVVCHRDKSVAASVNRDVRLLAPLHRTRIRIIARRRQLHACVRKLSAGACSMCGMDHAAATM